MRKQHSNHFQKFLVLVILGTILYHCSSGSTRETYDTLEQHDARKKEIKVLVANRSTESLQKLLADLRSDNKNSRIMAAHSLHFFAVYLDQAFPDMERALSDPEWQVRTGAVAAFYYTTIRRDFRTDERRLA